MEEKLKVGILGTDYQKLKVIVDKVNATRPVEVSHFSNLKEFLMFCIQTKPELVGISVNFPHKSVMQFPKVFKMALGACVIVFGEKQDAKGRKLLAGAQADFKISGMITAHNLWMKIIGYQKMKEEDQAASSGGSMSSQKNKAMDSTVHLKGGNDTQINQQNNNLLNSLFSALGESAPDDDSNMNHVSSSGVEGPDKDLGQLLNSDSGNQEVSSSLDSVADQLGGSSSTNKSGVTHASGGMTDDAGMAMSDREVENASNESSNTTNAKSDLPGEGGEGQSASEDRKGSSKSEKENNVKLAKPGLENENNPNSEQLSKNSADSSDGESNRENNSDGNEFGKVKLADEKEIKAAEKERKKVKNEQEERKQKDILIESCELALKDVFLSNIEEGSEEFANRDVYTFIVDMPNVKGYLLLANTDSVKPDEHVLKDFKAIILENIKNKGYHAEISDSYQIDAETENYFLNVTDFCDFVVSGKTGEGSQQVASFVKRESVWPKFEDSDKEDMYLVDIKVIPPRTLVNFDAFIFLPKNNRFVRYLKEGRSLSLAQAKRHTENLSNSKFYLPKDHKSNFTQFFIQNTIRWEFVVRAMGNSEDDAA